jgi:hypothetical protein
MTLRWIPVLLFFAGCATVRVVPGPEEDPNAPGYPLGDYLARRDPVIALWKRTLITARNETLQHPRLAMRLLHNAGLEVKCLDPRLLEESDEFQETPYDWAREQHTRNGWDFLGAAFPTASFFVDESAEVCMASRPTFESSAPLGCLEARELAKLLESDEETVELEKTLAKRTVSVDFPKASLYDVVDMIQENAKVNIVIAAAVRKTGLPDREISFSADRENLGVVLDRLAEGCGLEYSIENRVILFTLPGEGGFCHRQSREALDLLARPVRIDGSGLAIREVAKRLGAALGKEVAIDPATWRRSARYDFHSQVLTAAEIVAILQQGAPLRVSFSYGKIWFLEPGPTPSRGARSAAVKGPLRSTAIARGSRRARRCPGRRSRSGSVLRHPFALQRQSRRALLLLRIRVTLPPRAAARRRVPASASRRAGAETRDGP